MYKCTFVLLSTIFYVTMRFRMSGWTRVRMERTQEGWIRKKSCYVRLRKAKHTEEKDNSPVPAGHGQQMAQWLSGPEQLNVLVSLMRSAFRLGNDTGKGDNFTGRYRGDGHFNGRILQPLQNQFRQSAIRDFLRAPEQFKVVIPHRVVTRIPIIHDGLRN